MPHMDEDSVRKENITYSAVETVIKKIIGENKKPTIGEIKSYLEVTKNSLDQIIEYYLYMWEQRHTATYLDNIQPMQGNELPLDFAKRSAQLEESLAMMRATIEATEDALLMINQEGKLIGFNKKLVQLVGLPESVRTSKDETEGLNYLFGQIANPKELANLVMQKYQDPISGACGEMQFKDGKIVERFYQPQIVNDHVVGHVWSLRDVTEKRKQEESLRLSNRAITASTHGIILIENTPDYKITYLNPASLHLLQLDEKQTLHKSFLKAIAVLDEHKKKLLEIFQSKTQESLMLQYPSKNKILWLEIHIDPVYEKDQKTISHFVAIINDVTKNKELENILHYKALHDTLTGLPNKMYLEDAIRYRIKKAMNDEGKFGLLFIDIDRFKNINDTLGHGTGDKLLSLFGKRLQNIIQKGDVIARIGGDEFIILIDEVEHPDSLNAIATRLLEACRKKFKYAENEFNVSASIGIVQYPDCGSDAESLIRNADIAMYHAKFTGRNRACYYTSALNLTITRRVMIENELHNAIKNNEFELFYQPIFTVSDKKFNNVESLMRWKNKNLESVPPSEFIPIAEDIGMMTSIGRWVIETAIAQDAIWEKKGINDLIISINISAKQLLDDNFVKHVNQTLNEQCVVSRKIILEITESFFLLEDKIFEKLDSLHNIGIKIAIDDFGTGYSNLNYLNKLHVSYLKIDKTFVDQIETEHFDDSVLLAIISIAKRMKFRIIAEGVETKKQLQFLEKNGCDEIQGFYFSKPLPSIELEKFLQSQKEIK